MVNELPLLQLPTVDDALADASTESKAAQEMKNFSVRMPEDLKEAAQGICARHGTELGTFLRKCAENLVGSYGPPPKA